MANVIISPNMNLPIPITGQDPGPDYANQVNNSLNIVDGHNHEPGSGVQITPGGLDINSDLTFLSNNATALRSVRFAPQMTNLSGASDIGCLYESGVDLWYNDGSGNQVRITASGNVAGTPGSISNLTPPASVSYSSVSQTFTFQSDTSTAGNLDAGSITLRNLTASSPGITLSPPSGLASSFTLTLPTLPAANLPVSLSTGGILSAAAVTYAQLSTQVQQFLNTQPQVTVYSSAGTGSYTTPTNPSPLYLEVEVIGGGGGGGAYTDGSVGGDSLITGVCFTSGGAGGRGTSAQSGGAGGGATASSPPFYGIAVPGSYGAPGSFIGGGGASGGQGAASPVGGAGSGGSIGDAGVNGSTGSGGGGGSTTTSSTGSGGGGGSGGYCKGLILGSIASSYSWQVGNGGPGSSGSGSILAGGNGGDGLIIIKAYFGA